MNQSHRLLAAMLFFVLPSAAQAIDLTTIDRSIKKEPSYQTRPRYGLLVFGKDARTRVWLIVDGRRLYVDRNGNGDLTERGESVKATSSATSSFTVPVEVNRVFLVDQLQEADGTTVHNELKLTVHDDERFRCSIELVGGRGQVVGARTEDSLPRLAARPHDAPIIHFNGPMTLGRYDPILILSRTSKSTGFRTIRVWIGSPGLGAGTFARYRSDKLLKNKTVTAEFEFPGRTEGADSITRRDERKVGASSSYGYFRPAQTPVEAGSGFAKITLSMPEHQPGRVTPSAIKALIVGGPQDVATLTAALQTDDQSVRKKVMSAIRSSRFREARDEVLDALVKQFDSDDRAARRGAVRGLTEFKTPQVFALMIEALDDADASIRAAAIHALSGYDDRSATVVGKMVAALSDDDPTVRRAAADELGGYAPYGPAATQGLVNTLEDPNHEVRAKAAGSLRVSLPESGSKTIPKIVPLLKDREQSVRSAAINAIAAIDRTAIGPLIDKLKTGATNDEIVQELAAQALHAMSPRVYYNKSGNVKYITFYHSQYVKSPDISDDDMKLLGHLSGTELLSDLTSLNLERTQITDDGLRYIAGLTKLTSLSLTGTKITDDGLRHLRDLTNLTYLALNRTQVTDEGLVHLSKMTKLSKLRLHDGPATTLGAAKAAATPKVVFLHDEGVTDVAFSPEGRTVLTASHDGTARLWAAATGKPIGKIMQHESTIWDVAFSPDGKFVVSGSYDMTARLWDAATGEPHGKIMRHPTHVDGVAFSPDGKTVLTADYDNTARLWDAATGEPRGRPMRHERIVSAMAFSPDGDTVLTGSHDHTARFWDAATGKPHGKILRPQSYIDAVAFSPDGTTVLIGCYGKAQMTDVATGKPRGKIMPHKNSVKAAAFSPNGLTVLTGSFDKTARLWNARTGQPRGKTMEHNGPVLSLAFSPDGRTVLTGSADNTARLWDATTGEPSGRIMQHKGRVNAVAFSPDGKTVLTGSADKSARLWDVITGEPIK